MTLAHQMPLLALCAVAVSLSVVGLTGCSGTGESGAADKAGALGGVVVLQLGDADKQDAGDLPVLTYFADQVEEVSDGALRIDTTYAAAGADRPDAEQEVARMVRDGKFDLGYVGAQGWDELGVESFAGLFAPLLVDDDALLNAVAQDRLAAEMLGGLRRAGVVGLALVPRSLGPPVGLEHPFVNPDDFAGSRVAVRPSRVADAAMRALRARPVHLSEAASGDAVAAGRVDAQLPAFDLLPVAGVVAANVSLLPKLNTLFVNPDSLEALTDDQQLALRAAAARTVAHVIATRPTAQAALERFCSIGRGASPTGGGRAVFAGASDLDALVRATRPVYAELRRDPRARAVIARIRTLKRSLPPHPALRLPRGCSTPRAAPGGGATSRPPSALNGTYRWLLTAADAYAFGPGADNEETLAELPSVVTMTLDDGQWQNGQGAEADRGTYTVAANRISFAWPAVNSVLTFAYSADPDGTLHLTPLPSVERGDRFVWSSQPWRRIGPPVIQIP
jgi:TRAP-type C4-dicarboxylate transport system substrate-binding protein